MRTTAITAALLLASLPGNALAAEEHIIVQPNALKWTAAPPIVPPGARMAVLAGDPTADGPYVVRVRLPSNYKVAAHTHPTDENVTVVTGTLHIGMGDKLDTKKGEALKAGGFALMGKDLRHYAWTTTPAVIQIHGQGPLEFIYVDPNDDPRNATARGQAQKNKPGKN